MARCINVDALQAEHLVFPFQWNRREIKCSKCNWEGVHKLN